MFAKPLLAAGLLTIAMGTAQAETIILVADAWCPYNCDPDSERPGFMVEIAQRVFSAAGYKVVYLVEPWNRAQQSVQAGRYQGLIGVTPRMLQKLEQPLQAPQQEQARIRGAYFTLADSTWRYNGTQSLYSERLGLIAGYGYAPIRDYIAANEGTERVQYAHGEDALQNNLNKLLHGRISLVRSDELAFRYTAKQMGLADRFRDAGGEQLGEIDRLLYIAFAPEEVCPACSEYAQILSDGMSSLRQSGELEKILARYGLHDWQQAPGAD
ncbi:transporter substrate-binding domain-containing protein [Aquipseudomonas campi]|uniref:Transporter substrate-binding domain-containing protein n=1 Tax=Aquipseudomonas campi TaxID=2731681 RepID=A0A6M8FJM8_9GAMM|nr:transporter substrate-binding domain-containing protein [Pseudomonas campi]QKE64877.1 transporter substrate-binding domain-containing protein [Pseudomonas campi]